MRKACEELLMARFPIEGLAACALRSPDGNVTDWCFNRWLTPTQVRKAFAEFALNFEVLHKQEIPAVRMVWLFEHLRVVLCLRPDQACLAFFLENRADLPLTEVQALLDEFARLPISDESST